MGFIKSNERMKIKPPTNYVQPNIDVHNGDWIIILNEGQYRKIPQQPDREVLTFQVQVPSGEKKYMSMNATSQKEFIQVYGDDSLNWVGKRGEIEIVRQRVFDKFKDVIYIHPQKRPEEVPTEEIPVVE